MVNDQGDSGNDSSDCPDKSLPNAKVEEIEIVNTDVLRRLRIKRGLITEIIQTRQII